MHSYAYRTTLRGVGPPLEGHQGVIRYGESESGSVEVTTWQEEGARLEKVGQKVTIRPVRPIKHEERDENQLCEQCQRVGHRKLSGHAKLRLDRTLGRSCRGPARAVHARPQHTPWGRRGSTVPPACAQSTRRGLLNTLPRCKMTRGNRICKVQAHWTTS